MQICAALKSLQKKRTRGQVLTRSDFSAGGVQLSARDGKLLVSNTLEARLDQIVKQVGIFFSQSFKASCSNLIQLR